MVSNTADVTLLQAVAAAGTNFATNSRMFPAQTPSSVSLGDLGFPDKDVMMPPTKAQVRAQPALEAAGKEHKKLRVVQENVYSRVKGQWPIAAQPGRIVPSKLARFVKVVSASGTVGLWYHGRAVGWWAPLWLLSASDLPTAALGANTITPPPP